MGLIVNKPIIETDFAEICDFLDIDLPTRKGCSRFIWWPRGYPKRVGFAFTEFHTTKSNELSTSAYSLTGTRDVIEAMAQGVGPKSAFLAMGYAAGARDIGTRA